jgi:hypothetical protein
MIKKLKRVLLPCFFSIICGAICGRLVYSIYDKKLNTDINGKKIYLIQAGAYSTYDNMVNHTLLSNYVYYEDDDGLYKSVIGLTEEYENIEKIKSTYKENVIVDEYYSKDEELNKKIKEYDEKIKKTTDEKELKKIIKEMLILYKDRNVTLIQINS